MDLTRPASPEVERPSKRIRRDQNTSRSHSAPVVRRYTRNAAKNSGAPNADLSDKRVKAVAFFNGLGATEDLKGVFSQTSFNSVKRMWYQYAAHKVGLPTATPTPKPNNLVPALTHAYQSLHILRSPEPAISHTVNKDYAISTVLLNFRNAYQDVTQQYQQSPAPRSVLRKAVSRPDSESIPDSALVKEYLLRKLNEGSGVELVGTRRWAIEGFLESLLRKGGNMPNWRKCLAWGC